MYVIVSSEIKPQQQGERGYKKWVKSGDTFIKFFKNKYNGHYL